MAKTKNKKNLKEADTHIVEIVEEWIEYVCPKRGKVKELVKVKKLKKIDIDPKVAISSGDLLEDLESKEDNIISTDIEE